jgi:ribosomal protein S18 acetylase RimI-like enzyme
MSTVTGLYYGVAHVTEAAEAAAVWFPPERRKIGPLEAARCGFYSYPFKLGFKAFLRFGRYMEASEKKHNMYMPEPHWYLLMIGVHPDHQGQGLGSVLIRHALATADRDRRPAYLESSTPQSRALYQRHGFEVLEELVVEPGAPPLWLMRRGPRQG